MDRYGCLEGEMYGCLDRYIDMGVWMERRMDVYMDRCMHVWKYITHSIRKCILHLYIQSTILTEYIFMYFYIGLYVHDILHSNRVFRRSRRHSLSFRSCDDEWDIYPCRRDPKRPFALV